METQIVGVDVSKSDLASSMQVGEEIVPLDTVANNQEGFEQLAAQIQAAGESRRQVHLILEPTGGYELPLSVWAWEQGWLVSLPNPWQVKSWADSQGRRAKTDAVDSRILTRYGMAVNPPTSRPLPLEIEQLDQLLRRKEDLEKMLRQEQNRQQNLVNRPHLPPAVLESLQQIIDSLQDAISELEAHIQELIAQHQALHQKQALLLAVAGVGQKTVAPLLVLLSKWDTLTDGQGDAKSLTAYVGLDPAPFQSGSSVYKRPAISKKGNRSIRSALFNAAKGGTINGNSPLRQFYLRLIGNNKPKRVAWVAAARKILVWAWAVFRSNSPFDAHKAVPA